MLTMGVLGRIATAALDGIAELPAVRKGMERHRRIASVRQAAHTIAYGPLDDEAAREALAAALGGRGDDVDEAVSEMSRPPMRDRAGYVDDRAYRLLAAVAADAPVEPVAPERSELYAREETLGRMPIRRAFASLAEIEPRLLEFERRAPSALLQESGSLPPELSTGLRPLVGGGAEREDELLRSKLASSIAQHYLRVLAGDSYCGSPEMPFFENPRKTFSVTIAFRRASHAPARGQ
jgi:hypothetical protein